MTARPQEPASSEQWLESEHWSEEDPPPPRRPQTTQRSEEDRPPPRRPQTTQPPPVTARRVTALLRSPAGLRQVIVAKEILDPPVALRRRRAIAWRR